MGDIFDLPTDENRPRVLGATGLLSLLFHGLILGALGLALPLNVASPPKDAGISIDLETLQRPEELARAVPDKTEAESPKAQMPKQEPAPKPELAPKPEPVPRPQKKARSQKEAVKKAQAPQSAAAANRGSKAAVPGSNQAKPPNNQAKQAALKVTGETSPPAPGPGMPKPPYPELARKRGQEGTVNVRCQVDAEGRVTGVELAKSSGFKLLDEAALKAVGKWKFRPGKKDGANVAGSVVVPVRFKLQ